VQLNRPTKRNAMTSAMYVALARIFNEVAHDENMQVVLWHGAGDSFCAGNDIEDFLKNPPGPGESPQAGLMNGESTKFQMPLINLAVVPEWTSVRLRRYLDRKFVPMRFPGS
jgi:enoyl-CoA hydratase/carnithine racemase